MIYVPDSDPYVLVYGGYSYYTNESKINMQYSLEDMWVYYIKANTWRQVFPNSDNQPGKGYGASLAVINVYQFILYGGVDSDKVFNDLWLFNKNTNFWIKLTPAVYDANWPLPVKQATLVKFSDGLVLYGGSFWNILSYTNEYSNITTGSNRLIYFSNETWVLTINKCMDNCNNRGTCFFGKCKCDESYFGQSCEFKRCKSSICYYDTDILADENCYHCSGHGLCIDETCSCESGWIGDDCSIKDCPNNCNGYGYCQIAKPVAQCICNQEMRRGGDECSVIFCLNDCTNGVCDYTTGVCKCNPGWFGIDCSIMIFPFRNSSTFISMNRLIFLISLILLS
jgi:hypothetical protein